MKISEKKALSIEINHSDIVEALFDYIMDRNPDMEGDWEIEDMDVVFTTIRKRPGGGDELRATVTSSSNVVNDLEEAAKTARAKEEKARRTHELFGDGNHDKVSLIREEHDHDLDHD